MARRTTRPLSRLFAALLTSSLLVAIVALPTPAPAAAASFSDISGNPFAADISWLADAGVTNGCGGGRFCPRDAVTRAQMASFLVRMFDLPATSTDYFSDDAGSLHQSDINALAASGVTNGCGGGVYCPDADVTREQMASFISRAAALPAASADYFRDDAGSPHQADINRLATAGVSNGCGAYIYCPAEPVLREQMAAFLHRLATGSGSVPPVPPTYVAPPACAYADVLTARTGYANWNTSVLDTIYMLPSSYYPGDLVSTANAGLNGGYLTRSFVIPDLAAMARDARSANAPLQVVSAFRSYNTQVSTFNYWVSVDGYQRALETSARPGHSEHQLGTTFDFTNVGNPDPFGRGDWAATPAGAWMRDNAWRYGFVMSYPAGKQALTCYAYEPWHYRYVGRSMAQAMHDSGLTPREWLWNAYGN